MSELCQHVLTMDEFLKYRNLNKEVLPEILEYSNLSKQNRNPNRHTQHHDTNWRKSEQVILAVRPSLIKSKQSDDDKLYSEFRSVLNKLSESNFDVMAKDLIERNITNPDHLAKLAELLFDKAISEAKFSPMYAKLSRELSAHYVKTVENTVNFRELLISRCQQMFNNCILPDSSTENKFVINTRTSTGAMTFIGELYNYDLLTSKIINGCMISLLKLDYNKSHLIDCLSSLIKIIGGKFSDKCRHEFNHIFEAIGQLIASGELQSRDKFTLMDLMDLKKKKHW